MIITYDEFFPWYIRLVDITYNTYIKSVYNFLEFLIFVFLDVHVTQYVQERCMAFCN